MYFDISPSSINTFLGIILSTNLSKSTPSTDTLAIELTSGTITSWPSSSHMSTATLSGTIASTMSLTLANLIYLIGIGASVDFGSFADSQLKRHIASYALKLLIALSHFLSTLQFYKS